MNQFLMVEIVPKVPEVPEFASPTASRLRLSEIKSVFDGNEVTNVLTYFTATARLEHGRLITWVCLHEVP